MTVTNRYDVTYDEMMHIFAMNLWTRLIFDHVLFRVAFVLPCLVVVPYYLQYLLLARTLRRRRHAI